MFALLLCPAAAEDAVSHWLALPDAGRAWSAPEADAPREGPRLAYRDRLEVLVETEDWLRIAGKKRDWFWPQPLAVRETPPPDAADGNLPIGSEIVNRQTPLPLDYKPSDLVRVPKAWHYYSEGKPPLLRARAARAMQALFEAARKDDIELRVVSGYRSAWTQRYLYLRKIDRAGLDQKLVAKPGHSEHQLGTTIDVCGLDPETVLRASFAETPEGRWIAANCERFGFRLTYGRDHAEAEGYAFEPWHLRYLGEPVETP